MRFKHTKILASSILFGAMTSHVIAAEFKVPVSYEIMYVDLKEVSKFGSDFSIDLGPGHHQIVIRYHQTIRNSDNLNLFKSEPIIIDMDMEKDAKLELKAPHIRREDKATDYAKQPTFTIINTNDGSKVDYKERMLPFKPGFQVTRDLLTEIKEFTGAYVVKVNPDTSYAPEPASKSVTEANEFKMLQFWFNKSDEATRKDFRIWMVDNTHQPKVNNTQFEMLTFWYNKANTEERKAFQVWLVK
ncbi:MAG: YccT family protein [Marinomonas sp.]